MVMSGPVWYHLVRYGDEGGEYRYTSPAAMNPSSYSTRLNMDGLFNLGGLRLLFLGSPSVKGRYEVLWQRCYICLGVSAFRRRRLSTYAEELLKAQTFSPWYEQTCMWLIRDVTYLWQL